MKIRKSMVLAAAVGAIFIAPALAAAPAYAATSCSGANFDRGTGYATANCTGYGQMRFRVTCNAVWPYSSWTKTSGWLSVANGNNSMVAAFPSCGGPSSSVSVQYP